jgi:hypothetical protein
VNYEVIRRSLDFDLGTMQLTPEGLWLDPGPLTPETLGDAKNMYASAGMIDGGAACLSCGVQQSELMQPEPPMSGVAPEPTSGEAFPPVFVEELPKPL